MAVEDRRPSERPQPTTEEKIVDAAMRVYARHGIAVTPLREVARDAGTSVGAVQHYFSTKGELTRAVNNRVLEIVTESIDPNREPVDATTVRADGLIQLMADDPTATDYLRRVFVEDADGEVGCALFDTLAKLTEAQGMAFLAEGMLQDDIDFLWSSLHPLILRLGAIMLREHVERFLPGSFYDEQQLARWNDSIRFLLQHGYINATGPDRPVAAPEVVTKPK